MGNPQAAPEIFLGNIGYLSGRPANVDVALLFPEADHYLGIDRPYPAGLLECAAAIRDVADFDVVDERLIAAGALDDYGILIIVDDPLIEESTWLRLHAFLGTGRRRSIIQLVERARPERRGRLDCVDGMDRPPLTHAGQEDRFVVVTGKPDGDDVVMAVQRRYAERLAETEKLKEVEVNRLTARDGVWAGLFEDRVLLYNTTEEERTVEGVRVSPRAIVQVDRERGRG
jgi:hypothetical protein